MRIVVGGLYCSKLPERERQENELLPAPSVPSSIYFHYDRSWLLSKWRCSPNGEANPKYLFAKPIHGPHPAAPLTQNIGFGFGLVLGFVFFFLPSPFNLNIL